MAEEATLQTDEIDESLSEFDPASLPLGTFSAFDVSDQPMWTTPDSAENPIPEHCKNAAKAMVESISKVDAVARRIEVQGSWMLQLLDRGFHRLKPTNGGGWSIYGSGSTTNYGVYGEAYKNQYYDTNVIGEKNDIIVSCLQRDVAEQRFFPNKPGDDNDETYAKAANDLKYFIAEEGGYEERQGEVSRFFCTDERALAYTRPVADAQRWGYEDAPGTDEDEAPEVQGDDSPPKESNRPKIRTLTTIYGKLNDKCPIMAKSIHDMQWRQIAEEWDIALAKSSFPWIADKITAGDIGIAELKLDKLARQSINLAMQSNYATGDSMQRDCTITRVWFRPGFYMDDSCPKDCRSWFWTNFPKGFLVVYAAGQIAFMRNESMDEVLAEFHCRTGNGQNRRSLTESYAGPQMRLNVLVDLRDEFARKCIPRVGLDSDVWDVPALRASSMRAGVFEPFKAPAGNRPASDTIVTIPAATGTTDIAPFIDWLSGPLAEQLTHAQPALAASEGNDPETLGQSRLQNDNAMSSFGEAWRAITRGFAVIMTQAVAWNARVQPESASMDTNFPGKGRLRVKMADLKMGSGVARVDGEANFPESWSQRQQVWQGLFADAGNPGLAQTILQDPMNLSLASEFLPKGAKIPGVSSVQKQQGEMDLLLRAEPLPNPQYAKLAMMVQMGTQAHAQQAMTGQQPDPQEAQLLQQAQQMLQTMPQQISSVPMFPADKNAIEATVCDDWLNSADGRRMAHSRDPKELAAYQNVVLHWQAHDSAAKKEQLDSQQPIPPRTSITVDASKLAPPEQAEALQKLGINADPASIQQNDAMQPHEISTKEKGIGPSGSEIERTTSVVGKQLS